jgi:hypothetical protein
VIRRVPRFRNLPLLVAAALALAATASAGAALDRGAGVGFASVPGQVPQGKHATLVANVKPSGVRCRLAVRYAGGTQQSGLAVKRAMRGRVSWRWLVPETVALGAARATVTCARAGTAGRTFTVAGKAVPARVVVDKHGWSVRIRSTAAMVSYGLVLRNQSPSKDALNVSVLVNFVTVDNVLIGSQTTRVAAIPAGGTYMLGNMLTFVGSAPIARLEPVITVAASQPKALHVPPVADVRVLPAPFEPGWTGSVEGQLLNDHPSNVLGGTVLSVVVFDSNGNVVGGGLGSSGIPLPPGERVFWKVQSGVNAIPVDKAVSAQVSLEPRWTPAGS